jgi:26S proteasome regulatory subunit N2
VRNSACHQATVLTNAYIHAGTSVHQFLHDNLDWLARATNWAKFSATASLGVIHKGNLKDSRNVLSKYLPQEVSQSPYSGVCLR